MIDAENFIGCWIKENVHRAVITGQINMVSYYYPVFDKSGKRTEEEINYGKQILFTDGKLW